MSASGGAQPSTQVGTALRSNDPRSLGPYTVLRRLGQGGMGTVYLGRDAPGTQVAIKVVKAELAGDAEFARHFRREVEAASRVPAFCTARVLDAGDEAGRPYLVTEFISGPTLAEAVSGTGPLAASDLAGLAVGMAAALSAIHGAHVVHRDLKPSNVLLSPVGPRVIDFGIARALELTATLTSQIIGTPAFMAPEQLTSRGIGPATDIYAWGGTLVYASSGQPPHGSGNLAALLYRIVSVDPDLSRLDGDLRDLVARAMDRDPSQRPTSRQLLDALVGGPAQLHSPAADVLGHAGTAVPPVAARAAAPGAGEGAPDDRATSDSDGATPDRDGVRTDSGPHGRGATFGVLRGGSARRRNLLVAALAVVALVAVGLVVRQVLRPEATGATEAPQTADQDGDGQPGLEDDATGGAAPAGVGDAGDSAADGDIAIDGDAVAVADVRRGDIIRLRFTGDEGERVNLVTTGSTMEADVSIVGPLGEAIASAEIGRATAANAISELPVQLPTRGNYRVVVVPRTAGSGELTLTRIAEYDIDIDGQPVVVDFARPAQDVRLLADCEAGQTLALRTDVPAAFYLWIDVIDPAGVELGTITIGETEIEETHLGAAERSVTRSGTCVLEVDHNTAQRGTVAFTLSS